MECRSSRRGSGALKMSGAVLFGSWRPTRAHAPGTGQWSGLRRDCTIGGAVSFGLSVLLLGSLVTCDGHGGAGPPDAGSTSPEGDAGQSSAVAAELSVITCGFVERCCQNSTSRGCASQIDQLLNQFGPRIWGEIADGGIVLSSAAVAACESAVSTTPCARLNLLFAIPECRAIFQGAAQVGAPCSDGLVCADGGVCSAAQLECVLGGTFGSQCSRSEMTCVAGFCSDQYCSVGLGCFGGMCQPWAATAQPCGGTPAIECYPSSDYCECANGATECADGGVCAPLKLPGEPCVSGSQCSSLECSSGACAAYHLPTFTCQ